MFGIFGIKKKKIREAREDECLRYFKELKMAARDVNEALTNRNRYDFHTFDYNEADEAVNKAKEHLKNIEAPWDKLGLSFEDWYDVKDII